MNPLRSLQILQSGRPVHPKQVFPNASVNHVIKERHLDVKTFGHRAAAFSGDVCAANINYRLGGKK